MERTRTRGEFIDRVCTRDSYYLYQNGQIVLQPKKTFVVPNAVGHTEWMTDIVTPGFRKVMAEGGIVNTPMSRQIDTLELPGTSFTGRSSQGSSAVYANDYIIASIGLPAVKPTDAEIISDLRTRTATSARAGVEAAAVQGQVSLAELVKTLKMIRRPLSGLRNYIQAYLKRKRNPRYKGGPTAVATVASCWLEFRYGWRPFIMELEALLEVLFQEKFPERKTSRAKQERIVTSTIRYTDYAQSNGYGVSFLVDFTERHTQTYTVRSGILYDSHNDYQGAMGMRWADLPEAAWELIPFSFVVDWFVNVGDLIGSLTPKTSVRYLAEFETVRVVSTAERTITRISGGSQTTWSYTTPSGVHKRTMETFVRVPRVSPPGLVLELDLFEALRGARVFDALGLLIQLFQRGR